MSEANTETLLLGALVSLRPAAHRWSHDQASAEDLMHDTLERALRNLQRFRPGTCARAWLATIMRRLAIDSWRNARRERRSRALYLAETAGWVQDEQDHQEGGEQDAAAALPPSRENLRALADTLVEPFKSTFILWAEESLSYREISQRTGSPMGTVATRLMRARTALRARRFSGTKAA